MLNVQCNMLLLFYLYSYYINKLLFIMENKIILKQIKSFIFKILTQILLIKII